MSVGRAETLFPIVEFDNWRYDVTADGKRFLVRDPLDEPDVSPMTILTDWTAILPKR